MLLLRMEKSCLSSMAYMTLNKILKKYPFISDLLNEPIKRKILYLLLIFLVSFLFIIGIEHTFVMVFQYYDSAIDNHHTRYHLGQVIIRNLIFIERNLYKANLTKDIRDLEIYKKDIIRSLHYIEEILNVLQNGGTFTDIMPVNFYDLNEIKEDYNYSRKKSEGYVISVIDLTPKIVELKQKVLYLFDNLTLINGFQDKNRRGQLNLKINIILKESETILQRSQEIGNKIFYDSQQTVLKFQQLKKKAMGFLDIARVIVLLGISIIALWLSLRIIIQISNIIEAREKASKKLQDANNLVNAILNAAQVGVAVLDARTHRIRRMNASGLALIGAVRKDVIGASCHDFICTAKGYCPITDRNMTIHNAENILTTVDKRSIHIIKTAILSKVGNKPCIIESFMDITALKEAENRLIKLNNELEKRVKKRTSMLKKVNDELTLINKKLAKSNRELKLTQDQLIHSEKMAGIGQLAAGVAHEINNPTGFIISNLDVLAQYSDKMFTILDLINAKLNTAFSSNSKIVNVLNKNIKEFKKEMDFDYMRNDCHSLLQETKDGANRIKKIVANLKNFAHPIEEEFKLISLDKEIEKALTLVWNELKYTCQIEKKYSKTPKIYGNPSKLGQVFINILLNASQALKDNKGLIQIKTSTENSSVVVEFIDNGIGIPKRNLNKIFEPFFTTKEVGTGTGLGLSIAYGIIKEHKGNIQVKSDRGKGTHFILSFPKGEKKKRK